MSVTADLLSSAAYTGDIQFIEKSLLDDPSLAFIKDSFGFTMLMQAISAGRFDLVKMLVNLDTSGILLNDTTSNNLTPFMLAVMGGNMEILTFLGSRSKEDVPRALYFAACLSKGRTKVVDYLLQRGYNLYSFDGGDNQKVGDNRREKRLTLMEKFLLRATRWPSSGFSGNPLRIRPRKEMIDFLARKNQQHISLIFRKLNSVLQNLWIPHEIILRILAPLLTLPLSSYKDENQAITSVTQTRRVEDLLHESFLSQLSSVEISTVFSSATIGSICRCEDRPPPYRSQISTSGFRRLAREVKI